MPVIVEAPYAGFMGSEDELIAARFSLRRMEAEACLRQRMEEQGLHTAHGWQIVELTREVSGGIEWVLRPMHFWRVAPAGMECVVRLDSEDASVTSSCSTGHADP